MRSSFCLVVWSETDNKERWSEERLRAAPEKVYSCRKALDMNTPITAFTALIDIAEDEQCDEVEEYLKGKGAEITSTSDTELLTRLQLIIEQCHIVFQDRELPQQEVEAFFYSVVSLFHVIPPEQSEEFVELLCKKIVEGTNKETGAQKLRLLGLMFCHFNVKDPLCYPVLYHRVSLARDIGLAATLTIDVDKLQRWTESWHLSESQTRKLYQLLWETYKDSSNKTLPRKILTELLKTYTSSSAHEASQLAQQLIVLVISDPQHFIFDHLLSLEPIAALKSERIHQLLRIFVSERLSAFVKFYEANKEFVDGLGLEYSYCVRKMRLLTLTSLAVESSEVAFSTLTSELDLPPEEVEMLVLDAIRMKLIQARINQVDQKLIVVGSIHRTFGLEQWKMLHDRLSSWQRNIYAVKTSLKSIKT